MKKALIFLKKGANIHSFEPVYVLINRQKNAKWRRVFYSFHTNRDILDISPQICILPATRIFGIIQGKFKKQSVK